MTTIGANKNYPIAATIGVKKDSLYIATMVIAGITRIFSLPVSLTSDDAQNMATIIRAGKENNVEELEMELDKEIVQGIDLKALETSQNVNITLGQKGKSSYKLKIKYKK